MRETIGKVFKYTGAFLGAVAIIDVLICMWLSIFGWTLKQLEQSLAVGVCTAITAFVIWAVGIFIED